MHIGLRSKYCVQAAGGAAAFAIVPFTLLAMMPTNKTLMKKGPVSQMDNLFDSWNKMHLFRVAGSLVGLVTGLIALTA